MGLFDPVWKTENENKVGKAIAYVNKISGDAELATIAKQAHFHEVQQAAIERIADQAVLADIAMTGESYDFATKAAIEHISDPAQLDRVARGADTSTTRWLALKHLVERFGVVNLEPYADDIAGGVRAANADMLALSEDLGLMEQALDRYACESYSWSRDKAQMIRERANQVARERIETTSDLHELNHISGTGIYFDDVRMAARRKIESVVIPEDADQTQLFEAVITNPAVRESALSRLSDEQLLCEAIERIALNGSGEVLADAVGRIEDAALLERIAGNGKLEPATRRIAANRAKVVAPFGTRTLVCPECGDAVVYHEAYESYDSYKVIGWFCCETHCGATVDAGEPLDRFGIGEAAPDVLYGTGEFGNPGHLVLLCPDCRKLRGSATAKPDAYDRKPTKLEKCSCGSTAEPIPVIWSIDY